MRLAMNRKQIKKVQRKLMLYIILAAGFFGVNHIDCLSRLNQQFFFFPEVSKESEIGESIAAISPEVLIEEINETEVSDAPEPIGYICIQAGKLNVRETPNGTILGTVSQGETHDYFEEESGWLKIAYGEGEGYVCSKYGDIYDTNGDLVKPAGTSIQKSATAEPVQTEPILETVQAEPAAEKPMQEISAQAVQKNPEEMSKQELCEWVVSQIITPDMDDFDKVRAVNQYLCDHMTYDLNYYTTRDAILLGKGRCQGYANAFKNLMNTAGVNADYVRGYVGGKRTSTHAWNRVYIDGTYYYVDVTWNDSNGSNLYLLLGEEEFNRERTVISYNSKSE